MTGILRNLLLGFVSCDKFVEWFNDYFVIDTGTFILYQISNKYAAGEIGFLFFAEFAES